MVELLCSQANDDRQTDIMIYDNNTYLVEARGVKRKVRHSCTYNLPNQM